MLLRNIHAYCSVSDTIYKRLFENVPNGRWANKETIVDDKVWYDERKNKLGICKFLTFT